MKFKLEDKHGTKIQVGNMVTFIDEYGYPEIGHIIEIPKYEDLPLPILYTEYDERRVDPVNLEEIFEDTRLVAIVPTIPNIKIKILKKDKTFNLAPQKTGRVIVINSEAIFTYCV